MNSDNKGKILLMAGLLVFCIAAFLVFYLLQGKNQKKTPGNDMANTPTPTGMPFSAPGNSSYTGSPAANVSTRPPLTPPAAPEMISGNAGPTAGVTDPFAGGPAPPKPPSDPNGGNGGSGGNGRPYVPPPPPKPEWEVPIPDLGGVVMKPIDTSGGGAEPAGDGAPGPVGGLPQDGQRASNNATPYLVAEKNPPNMRLQGPDGVYTGWLINNNGYAGLYVALPSGKTAMLAAGDYLCGLKIRSLSAHQMILENEQTRQQLKVPFSNTAAIGGTT